MASENTGPDADNQHACAADCVFEKSVLTFTLGFFQKYKLPEPPKYILSAQHYHSSFYTSKIHASIKHCLVPAGGEFFLSFSLLDRLANCLILISEAVRCKKATAKSRVRGEPNR